MANALRQAIEDWQRAGLTDLPLPTEPIDLTQIAKPESAPASTEVVPNNVVEPNNTNATTSPAPVHNDLGTASSSVNDVAAAGKLELLREKVRTCAKCVELAASRTQTVFGVGDPSADVMFIGEAPGADEDRIGEPFVGNAGQLLNRIIAASGWRRDDLYICNILRCRPPGNRNPTDIEAANCREYLDGQIEAVSPRWIVCWGSVAAKNLLQVDKPIGRMRKQLFDYKSSKVLCTYHPSYLLRNPAAKKDVWSDLKFLFGEMGHTPPPRQ